MRDFFPFFFPHLSCHHFAQERKYFCWVVQNWLWMKNARFASFMFFSLFSHDCKSKDLLFSANDDIKRRFYDLFAFCFARIKRTKESSKKANKTWSNELRQIRKKKETFAGNRWRGKLGTVVARTRYQTRETLKLFYAWNLVFVNLVWIRERYILHLLFLINSCLPSILRF